MDAKGCPYCGAECPNCDELRQALVPFAFIGRGSMERLGLAEEYDEARRLLGLPAAAMKENNDRSN